MDLVPSPQRDRASPVRRTAELGVAERTLPHPPGGGGEGEEADGMARDYLSRPRKYSTASVSDWGIASGFFPPA